MGRLFIPVIVLYGLFLACYFAWERRVKRRQKAARRQARGLSRLAATEDILGKSGFDLRHSLPEATTLIHSEKRAKNAPIFAAGNDRPTGHNIPAAIPDERLDQVFSSAPTDDSGDVDIVIDDGPEPEGEEEADGYEDTVDTAESEDAQGVPAGAAMATGIRFDELSGMVRTVNDPLAAADRQREGAGRVLTEVRQTDLFEQVVSGGPERKTTAGRLMDDYFAAWERRRRQAGEASEEGGVKAPADFDPRAFAR